MSNLPWRPVPLALFLLLAGCAATGAPTSGSRAQRYDAATEHIAAWLRASELRTEHGTTWPADPDQPTSTSTNLYDGAPGVVLFLLQRHRATGGADPRDLADARAGADQLLATLPDPPAPAGLYVGVAGIGFVLAEMHAATGDARYLRGLRRCVATIEASARETDNGVTWSGVTDVISGSAGTGLFLLDVARRTGDRRALQLAVRAGHELVATRVVTERGCTWDMSPGYARRMPNFSHGTAGVAYFLVELHRATLGDQALADDTFLDAALEGADELRAIADEGGLVHHHTPGGEDLFYLGWCHGPPGTARLFWRLWQTTDIASYREDVERMASTLMACGIPEQRTPGFWNNVGVCCGSAGVAEFFADLARETGRADYAAFALRLTDDLLARGTADGDGLRWVQAEHRARPELLVAQTGLMQGAAGIGLWLLRAANPGDRTRQVRWPDSPW